MSRVQLKLLESDSVIKDTEHNSVLAYKSDNIKIPYDIPVKNNFCKYIKLLADKSNPNIVTISPRTDIQVLNETA